MQVAIDRVSVETASEIIRQIDGNADIVEIGTSLIKDFGLTASVAALKKQFPNQALLADIKTIDEGAYEFQRCYEAGADIATVMGGSSLATIEACQKVCQDFGREYLIDLLEVNQEKMEQLTRFSDAIFCLHLPSDKDGEGLEAMVRENIETLKNVSKVAVAGGVTLKTLDIMRQCGVELVVVGSAITKSDDIAKAAKEFYSAIHSN